MPSLNRKSSIPLYEQIKQIIRNQILSGEYVAGSRLPTEEEFCDHFSVSKITVKRALNDLARTGIIERRQGSGSIVAPKLLDHSFAEAEGFSSATQRNGQKASSKILGISFVEATEHLLHSFQLPKGSSTRFMRIRRLLLVNDRPGALLMVYVPEELGQKMLDYELENSSFYQLYQEISGLKITRNENILAPIVVPEDEAQVLGVEEGSVHMHIRGVSFFENDATAEVSLGIFSADMFVWKANAYRVRLPDEELPRNQLMGKDFVKNMTVEQHVK